MGYRKIAQYLNERDIKTARGNSWKNTQVFSVLKRYRQRQNREEVRETPSDIEFGKIELVWIKYNYHHYTSCSMSSYFLKLKHDTIQPKKN